jgi:alkylation response protein AidB-like acyl-CoA dehydrogenase
LDARQPCLTGDLENVGFAGASRWLVAPVYCGGGGRSLAVVDMSAAGVRIHDKEGFDLAYPLGDIAVRDVPCLPMSIVRNEAAALEASAVVLYCAELVGLASACFDLTKRHLVQRQQFGKPLASNQALRHMAADDLVALENCRVAVDYAAWALVGDPLRARRAVSVAKAYVSRAAVAVAENAIQIHGAMGFTWSYPLHVKLRRILRCASTLGTAAEHQEWLAAELLAENVERHASSA